MVEFKRDLGTTSAYHANGCDCYDFESIHKKVYELSKLDTSVGSRTLEALQVMERALDLYGSNGLAISFNGGKDCTVLLHLLAAVIYQRHLQSGGNRGSFLHSKIKSVYVRTPRPFDEVEEFVQDCVRNYGLDLISTPGPMKQGLQSYLDQRPEIKAVLVGTRRTDPHGAKLTHFLPTDPGWPTMMRIHPIIDWDYSDIWDFLLDLQVPYCPLYNIGYTSLGCVNNTFPNPNLRNDERSCGFDPAWKLVNGNQERDGR
ncbi:adenine nucleotide alpha hydrolases-like protein [Basidiobolus meristosporus CBS 931.73]|uniref:FAD synthase n=1 Tax=Basidiobolus meristosporus CBS 931.73 TaxID=1314790 RepID=A0A1Y1XR05_9FUNG|nr:adenine nucleotide alpha hydrolases-like protein [Basidiobolus meristosporus CBS 931.73]|eukprot:ORX88180.1 adenine nucleotide alpha hydrolases-like protein [Basidiobolus meristosporus CBS 931.73]